ncbi:MAG: NADH-quinone oxidoreductase subunit J [Sulfolobales archaeon]
MLLADLLSIILGILAIGSGLMVLLSRNLVYSAVYLSILGLLVASLIALLGLPTIGTIHLIVYVGAGVLFIVMTLSLIREEFSREEIRLRPIAVIMALVLGLPLAYLSTFFSNTTISLDRPDYTYISNYLSTYPYAIVVMIVVFALAMVASISIVMRERRGM